MPGPRVEAAPIRESSTIGRPALGIRRSPEMNWLWLGLYHGFAMFWETLWALVLGFGISAVLQVFVSKEQMTRAFGVANIRTMSLATGLGAASSSCSYAAVAAGRSAFQQ